MTSSIVSKIDIQFAELETELTRVQEALSKEVMNINFWLTYWSMDHHIRYRLTELATRLEKLAKT